jgi:hypothetical protein
LNKRFITQVSHPKTAKKSLMPKAKRNLFLSASGGKVKYIIIMRHYAPDQTMGQKAANW